MTYQKFSLKEFIPEKVLSNKTETTSYNFNLVEDEIYLNMSYSVPVHNQKGYVGTREFSLTIPKEINRNKKTFEVLGLLQAEMGKQHDGKINFCNHEYRLINKVLLWFGEELEFSKERWKWYIKVNMMEPVEQNSKQKVEKKVLEHWSKKTNLSLDNAYPKKVVYTNDSGHNSLKCSDYGTLTIERRSNLFSQIIKNFVYQVSHRIESLELEEIRAFMRGIIAGESNVEINKKSGHFRVFISAVDINERIIYEKSLQRLSISSIAYSDFPAVVISRRENLLELLQQKLICLSPQKYNKFLRIFQLYENFPEYASWKQQQTKPHNKIPQGTIERIIELHHQMPKVPAWKIAEKVGVSAIKVQRVRKENKIGKSVDKIPEPKRKEVARLAGDNQSLTQKEIAERFNISESAVSRACKKYSPK